MGLTNEDVGPKILAKIRIYIPTRAELLITLCYEIPCTKTDKPYHLPQKVYIFFIKIYRQ
jgi:hypothetical protein